LHQAADQFPTASALHRRHADNRPGFAILPPPAANRRHQPLEIGTRRCLFAGELASRDRVAQLTEGHDFAFEVPGGKPFRHVFRQGATERAHAFEPDRTTIAAVWSGREEELLSAALTPQLDDLRQTIGRGMVGLVNEKGLVGEVLGQVLWSESVQGRVGTGKGVVEGPGLAEVGDDPLHRTESAFPRHLDQGLGRLNGRNATPGQSGKAMAW
jgi:hypothetical protein